MPNNNSRDHVVHVFLFHFLVGSAAINLMYVYEVRSRKDHRGADLISDVLPFGRLSYGEPNAIRNAIGYAMHTSRSHDSVIRV